MNTIKKVMVLALFLAGAAEASNSVHDDNGANSQNKTHETIIVDSGKPEGSVMQVKVDLNEMDKSKQYQWQIQQDNIVDTTNNEGSKLVPVNNNINDDLLTGENEAPDNIPDDLQYKIWDAVGKCVKDNEDWVMKAFIKHLETLETGETSSQGGSYIGDLMEQALKDVDADSDVDIFNSNTAYYLAITKLLNVLERYQLKNYQGSDLEKINKLRVNRMEAIKKDMKGLGVKLVIKNKAAGAPENGNGPAIQPSKKSLEGLNKTGDPKNIGELSVNDGDKKSQSQIQQNNNPIIPEGGNVAPVNKDANPYEELKGNPLDAKDAVKKKQKQMANLLKRNGQSQAQRKLANLLREKNKNKQSQAQSQQNNNPTIRKIKDGNVAPVNEELNHSLLEQTDEPKSIEGDKKSQSQIQEDNNPIIPEGGNVAPVNEGANANLDEGLNHSLLEQTDAVKKKQKQMANLLKRNGQSQAQRKLANLLREKNKNKK